MFAAIGDMFGRYYVGRKALFDSDFKSGKYNVLIQCVSQPNTWCLQQALTHFNQRPVSWHHSDMICLINSWGVFDICLHTLSQTIEEKQEDDSHLPDSCQNAAGKLSLCALN